ncbi:MAG TPA: hypothetical protein VFR56_07595 [Actinomycetes bacterium]|nr:hypothetical protein [Actinomycetes bacterium]
MSERQGWGDDSDDRDDRDEVLSEQTSDDTDRGWGEHPDDADDASDIERLIREKPPHW